MKRNPKSAPLQLLLMALCLSGLAACEKFAWPHVYGPNEVPASIQNEPRPFADVTPVVPGQDYPLLGNVPSKPKNFTPAPVIDKTKQQMEDDRTQAEIMKEKAGLTPAASVPVIPE